MADAKEAVVEELLAHLDSLSREVVETKRTINSLRRRMGQPEPFPDAELGTGGNLSVRSDRFYGKPLATAVREYLEGRGQPATASDILAGLEQGGYDLDAQGWRKADRTRSLAISLAKNTVTFHRLPSGTFGLKSWYPNLPKKSEKPEDDAEETEDAKGAKGTKRDRKPLAADKGGS